MKKMILLCMILISVMTLYSCSNAVEGTWYDEDGDELILSRDGTVSYDGAGGTYTYDDGQVICVMDFMGISVVLDHTNIDGNEVLANDRYVYYRDYDVFLEIEAEEEAQREAEVAAEDAAAMSNAQSFADYLQNAVIGTWEYARDGEILVMNSDGTFTYKKGRWEDTWGTWEIIIKDEYLGTGYAVEIVFTTTDDEAAEGDGPSDGNILYNEGSFEDEKEQIDNGNFWTMTRAN